MRCCQAGASVGGGEAATEGWLDGLRGEEGRCLGGAAERGSGDRQVCVCVCVFTCMCVMWDRHVCFIIMVIRKHLGFMMRPCGCDEGIRNPVCLQIPTTSRAAEKLSAALFLKQGPNHGTAGSLCLCSGRRRYTKCFPALLPVQHLHTSRSIVHTHIHRQRPSGANERAHNVYLSWELRLLAIVYSGLALIFF